MSKPYVFPSFHFYPKELVSESKRIEEKYKDFDDHLLEELSKRKLPDLLKAIRNLVNEKSAILDFANTLKKIDIKILSYEYPYQNESEETLSKIMFILNERYSRAVGRRFWTHFHLLPRDTHLYSILNKAFTIEDPTFLSLETRVRQQYNNLFNGDYILNKLASFIGKEKDPVEESMKTWGIMKDTKLERMLWWLILKEYIGKRWFLKKESMEDIRKRLESFKEKQFKIILRSYISGFDFDEFDNLLLNLAIIRLKDPRINRERWDGFSNDDIEKVNQWLFKQELISFFEKDVKYDRFKYWKKHIKYINKLNLNDSPPIAAMYFGDFVAVEFAETGNAAYFYESEGFDRYMSKDLRFGISESLLKDKHATFFITKLNHTTTPYNPEHWHSRFDEYMLQFYNHNLTYNHRDERW